MDDTISGNSNLSKQIKSIKSVASAHKQSLVLGLSSSLNGGAVYGYIVSLDYHYFTPALGIVAGLIGGLGIAAKDIFSDNNRSHENHHKDIPLEDIGMNIAFGIVALILGYIIVYYFAKIPIQSIHGTVYSIPVEQGNIYDFLKVTLRFEDVVATILGAISSLALPLLLKKKVRALMQKLKINQFH